jgi:hypothetical protein
MEQRLARDQFSTREQLAKFNWIMMSEQVIVGQHVYIQYGTKRSVD